MLHPHFLMSLSLKLATFKRVRGSRCPSVFAKCPSCFVLLPAARRNSDPSKAALGASTNAYSKYLRCITNTTSYIIRGLSVSRSNQWPFFTRVEVVHARCEAVSLARPQVLTISIKCETPRLLSVNSVPLSKNKKCHEMARHDEHAAPIVR